MRRLVTCLAALGLRAATPGAAMARPLTAWSPATPEPGINTAAAEGCPIESPNGLRLYIASNRPGGTADPDPNDIWMATRDSVGAPWGPLHNLGAPVNSAAADYCPTPLHGRRLLFVSTRSSSEACGGGDIYLTRKTVKHGWAAPRNLGCALDGSGPNFPTGEFGPSLVETDEGTFLYFSSAGTGGDQDIWVSRMTGNWTFGPPVVVEELSTPYDDFMPNVRRDGLEIVLNSNRPGGFGGQDVYAATRASTADPWSSPVNLGPAVNTPGNETRASISGDGMRLHFGRNGDIYVSERSQVTGSR